MINSVRARDCALVADYYPLDCYTGWRVCGQKIPVRTLGTSRKTVGASVLLQTPREPRPQKGGRMPAVAAFLTGISGQGIGTLGSSAAARD